MAMLAEPRRKQKWSLDPRNSAWSNDDSKFGQKMLEKMGWSKGKCDGITGGRILPPQSRNITPQSRYYPTKQILPHKADYYPTKRTITPQSRILPHKAEYYPTKQNITPQSGLLPHKADYYPTKQNITHKAEYTPQSGLLPHKADYYPTKQNITPSQYSPASDCKKSFSLEEKSKSSKKRVHYMKFAKGKDLSCRSDTDLACIFGKREKRKKAHQEEAVSGSEESEEKEQESPSPKNEDELGNTVTSSLSVNEYFAKRMAQLKKSQSWRTEASEKSAEAGPAGNSTESMKENKKKKRSRSQGGRDGDSELVGSAEGENPTHGRRKSKSKKDGGVITDSTEEPEEPEEAQDEKLKRKKRKKETLQRIGNRDSPTTEDPPTEEPKKKKKKKQKS
ncbi:PIN2/TERF1-interacting telomerase inhibitor 1 [Mantella aurantiaca]